VNLYPGRHHPSLIPRLHLLPKTLQTEYVNWTGGNKLADIEHRIRRGGIASLSKILPFCNESTKVIEVSVKRDQERGRGSNKYLAGFLRKDDDQVTQPSTNREGFTSHVMVTTFLLSREPVMDEPRNMIDFLERYGGIFYRWFFYTLL